MCRLGHSPAKCEEVGGERAALALGAQDKKSAPLKLALLVGCGIMLPLGVAAWFLFRTQKYHGPNNVAQETLDIFCRCGWGMQWF